jgi:hypothetical protein
VALGKEKSLSQRQVMAMETLLSVTLTLGKGSLFAECLLYRHSTKKHLVGPFPVPLPRVLGGTRQRLPLCRVPARLALGIGSTGGALCQFLLPSGLGGTQQMVLLCRVPRPQHLAKKLYWFPGVPCLSSAMALTLGKVTRIPLFYLFLLFHPNIQKIYHIIITYTSYISHNHRIHRTHHISHKYHHIKQVRT